MAAHGASDPQASTAPAVARRAKRASSVPRRPTAPVIPSGSYGALDSNGQAALRKAGGNIATRRPVRLPSAPVRLPSTLLVPVNADSKQPRFTIVDVKLNDDADNYDWLQHMRDIRMLVPGCNGAVTGGHRRPSDTLLAGGADPVRLAPFLWLGDASHARDMDGLKKRKINAIVNLAGRDFARNGSKNMPTYPAKWECLQVDLYSEFEAVYNGRTTVLLGDHFQQIFVFMERCKRSGRTILVHCMTGMDRAPTVCVAFLMLQFQWSLPKALQCVLSHRPGAIEEQTFQEELLALAKVNDLLIREEQVTRLVEEAQGPAAEVWRLAAGDSWRIDDRKLITEAIRGLCPQDTDMSELDDDLKALQDSGGVIRWHQFKRWFMEGAMKAG